MDKEREFEPAPDENEVVKETSYEITDRGDLFGAPYGDSLTSPSVYHCPQCNEDILAQDIVWDQEDQSHCPNCDSILKRQQG